MKFRYATYVSWTILLGCVAFGHAAFAQTRLGLHVTQEELNIWRQRMTDNVNTINGFTFQSVYQNRILADANAFRSQSHPGGDGQWVGYTGGGCVPANDQSINPGSGGTPFGRGNGAWMMRSAFNFLLTGDVSYANPVRTELLSQIAQSGTNWSNTSKWCYNNLGGGNALEIVPWIYRLMLSFDYLNAGGYTGFSAQEKTNITNWLKSAAMLWRDVHAFAVQQYTSYPGVHNEPQDLTCVSNCTALYGNPTHLNGWQIRSATYAFSNQSMLATSLAMGMGVMTNDAALINVAAQWFTAFIKAGVYDDGAVPDYSRWEDCTPNCPGSMWGHASGVLDGLIAIADMYARAGNKSLYDLTAATQVLGGNRGTVSLRRVMVLFANLANKTTTYLTRDGLFPLSWDVVHEGNLGDFYHDFGSMVGNIYYKDSAVTTAMTRALKRSNTSGGCYDSQFGGCFSGIWGHWADLPFMFGNMEGKVNPYGGSSGPSVSLTESPSSLTSSQSSTLSWFSSNVTSCTASGGWSGSKATSGTQTVSPTQTTTYTLTCTGSGGSASASAKVTILSPLTQVQINSGDPAYTGTDGTYEADRYASGGNTYSTTASIANTPDPTLYQTERYGDFTYAIPMANGTYNVTLKFAEIFWTGTGQRVFNVDINGTRVLSNFDIVAQAGSANRAIDRTFPATVSNGMLSIAFSTVVDNAKVSAIKVNPYGTVPSPPSNLQVISVQ